MKNTNLANLQQIFSKAIREKSSDAVPSALFEIAASGSVSSETRLEIYQNSYFLRIYESLTEDYPHTFRILGKISFRKLVQEFIKKYPSHSWTLAEVGVSLSDFVRISEWNDQYPFLAELTRFEWQKVVCWLVPRGEGNGLLGLAQLDEEALSRVVLHLAPSVMFFESIWPVQELSELNDSKKLENWKNSTVCRSVSMNRVIIYQFRGEVESFSVTLAQWQILQAISSGKMLETLCEGLNENSSAELFRWFSVWSAKGVVSGFSLTRS